jgi:hypothetical protein
MQVGEKAATAAASAAQREGEEQGQQKNADGVVPVEELEAPFLAGKFLGVGP